MTTNQAVPVRRRICPQCNESRIVPTEIGAYKDTCKACAAALNAEYQRKRRADNPDLIRSSNLWRMYRITVEEYDALREAQGYRCAICRTHEDDVERRPGGRPRKDGSVNTVNALGVDHCHDRDAIRGLLCQTCNFGIANFKDDPDRLRAAATYVEQTPIRVIDRDRVRAKGRRPASPADAD